MRPLGVINGRVGQLLTVTAERLSLGSPITLIVTGPTVLISKSWHRLSAASSTNLTTINGAIEAGQVLLLQNLNSVKITLKDGSGNFLLAGDFTLDSNRDTILLIWDGAAWVEICRSNN